MLPHDLRLAWKGLSRTPALSLLAILVLAVGVGTAVVASTLYHARGANPIKWKGDRLFRVMLDSRPQGQDMETDSRPEYPPKVMIYRDALAVYQSPIPSQALMMLSSSGVVEPARPGVQPLERSVRFTTHEFFDMFDVPFLFGTPWTRGDDKDQAQVIIISRYLNDLLFAGHNSIGQNLIFGGQQFRVIGVIDHWLPVPLFYDPSRDFGPGEDVFLPFAWARSLVDLQIAGFCQKTQTSVSTFKEIESADCISTGVWAQLDSDRQRREFRRFLENYSRDQVHSGRYERPVNVWLTDVPEWLKMNNIVGNQSRYQLLLALVFLAICTLNALGLLLNKFFSTAPSSGVRRALGATRADIMRMHLMEALLIGAAASGLGMALAWVGLRLIRNAFFLNPADLAINPDYAAIADTLSHMDLNMVLLAVALSLGAGALAGIYPAWRIGRVLPASFLKSE